MERKHYFALGGIGVFFIAVIVVLVLQVVALAQPRPAHTGDSSTGEEPSSNSAGFTLASASNDSGFLDAPAAGDCNTYALTVQADGALLFVPDCDGTPPTPEPTATGSAEPSVTPQVTPTMTQTGSLPLCTDHDPEAYHGLISEDGSCHYAHTHGDDIFSADYADYPEWPFAQTVSYPHETSGENANKHAGYKSYGFTTPNGDCVILKSIPGVDGCVIGGRIQFHVVGGARGLGVRFHSFYAQFEIRNNDGSIGYVSTGGWGDFGVLHCTYKQAHCALDSDPASFNLNQPPYRAGRVGIGDGVSQWNSGCHNSGQQPCDYNQIASYDWITFDDWGGVNRDDLAELLFSDDPDRNHSTLRFYEFIVITPQELGNGRINFEGFTDLTGTIDESCTVAGAECVPLTIQNVDGGMHAFRVDVGTSGRPPQDRYYREFDLSPAGESWIEYPN